MDNIFHSTFVIDGLPGEATPAEFLSDCALPGAVPPPCGEAREIVDESPEHAPVNFSRPSGSVESCIEAAAAHTAPRPFRLEGPGRATRQCIGNALLEAMWKKGHFSLPDLEVSLRWVWSDDRVGNMAAFYRSVETAGEHLFDLGARLASCSVEKSRGDCFLKAEVTGTSSEEEEGDGGPVSIAPERICPETVSSRFEDAGDSWIVYIPFDPGRYRLGGSLTAFLEGRNAGAAPEVRDADYFLDCFEVVRECIEDGIVIAGTTVGSGGLGAALRRMCGTGGWDICADLSGLAQASGESDPAVLLFSEIPGALVQIEDRDYDYMDSQFLLQDIAFYPLGHPVRGNGHIRLARNGENGIYSILQTLLRQ